MQLRAGKILYIFFTFLLTLFAVSIFFRNSYSQTSSVLHLKINLEFISSHLIKGTLSTTLPPGKIFLFSTKNLSIKKVKIGKMRLNPSSYSNEFIKVFSSKYKAHLFISFKKVVKYEITPLNIFSQFFPLPNTPFTYEITFKLPRKMKVYPLIPSERIKSFRKKKFKVYIFKNQTPVLNPCLIITTHKLKKSSFEINNLKLKIYSLPTSSFSSEIEKLFQNLKNNQQILNNPGGELFPFKTLFIFIDKNFGIKTEFSNTLVIPPTVLNNFSYFSHLLIRKKLQDAFFLKDESLLEGLVTYLVDYPLSENKRVFRKYLLIFNKKNARSFFYIFELAKRIGEENFLNSINDFYKNHFLKPQTLKDFFVFLRKTYPEKLKDFPEFSFFHRIYLKGEVSFVEKRNNSYVIHLILSKNPSQSAKVLQTREVLLPLKIICGKASYLYQVKFVSSYESFQFTCKDPPTALYIDPDYTLWREVYPEERLSSIAALLYKKGVLIYSPSDLPVYKDIINFFKNLGYRESPSESNFPEKNYQNVIYFNKLPFTWIFHPPEKGFYIKVLSNPYNPENYIGYIYASSIEEVKSALPIIPDLETYSEIVLESGKIVLARRDSSLNGIFIPVKIPPLGLSLKNFLTPKSLATKLANTQLILIGEDLKEKMNFKTFYEEFLDALFNINSRLLILLDIPRSFNSLIKKFLENEISLEQVMSSLKDKELSLKIETLTDILTWAKAHDIKVIAGGLESEILKQVLEKGLKGLSKEELLKLPETDLFDPAYKDYLFQKYQQLKNPNFSFENFYQAQIFKKEALAESIFKLLTQFKDYQIIVISNKEKIAYPWAIRQSLRKKGIKNFKTIILSYEIKLNPEIGDYLFNGGAPPIK